MGKSKHDQFVAILNGYIQHVNSIKQFQVFFRRPREKRNQIQPLDVFIFSAKSEKDARKRFKMEIKNPGRFDLHGAKIAWVQELDSNI
jgi:hypothetical protein